MRIHNTSLTTARGLLTFTGAVSLAILPMTAWSAEENSDDIFDLSLNELMDVRVETASRKSQSIYDTAAAVYVISNEDIRRSGVTTLPDLLAPVPGLEVSRLNSSTWAITARGFNSQYANKLLVLIDGRSVYTPLFSGVFWDSQMPMLEDIEQIEIIRGPGASLWGANAVNGIINIITRPATETQGVLAVAGIGTEEKGFARVRYGNKLGRWDYRADLQFRKRDESWDEARDQDAGDDYDAWQGGIRFDRNTEHQRFTIHTELFKTDKSYNTALSDEVKARTENLRENTHAEGGFVRGKWTTRDGTEERHQLSTYFDWLDRTDSTYIYHRRTFSLDYQYLFPAMGPNQLMAGAEYRYIHDKMDGSYAFDLRDQQNDADNYTAFFQDDIALDEQLKLTLGVKLEQAEFAGMQWQPTARVMWHPNKDTAIWSAISRAIRTPSRAGRSLIIRNNIVGPTEDRLRALLSASLLQQALAAGLPEEQASALAQQTAASANIIGELDGSKYFQSETLIAYELGYRQQVTPDFYLDATTFYHDYRKLRTFDFDTIDVTLPDVTSIFHYGNQADGRSSGFEMAGEYTLSADWKLVLTYSYFNFEALPKNGHSGTGVEAFESQSPHNRVFIKSQNNLGNFAQMDLALKYYGTLTDDHIADYIDADLNLSWFPAPEVTLSLTGQNLLHKRRVEFEDTIQGPFRTAMERSLFAKVSYQY